MIRIITDSASDITQAEAKAYNIDVLALTTRFDDEVYLDGITITNYQFYEKLIETDIMPSTSCIAPGEYEEIFDKYANDDVIVITVSSKLSGCYQSAIIAKQERSNIAIIDSKSVTIGERILVELAIRLRQQGLNFEQIVATLENKVADIRVMGVLDTLVYLKKGGRIPPAAATIGDFLAIKPVVAVEDGVVVMLGKARGSKNGRNLLNEYVEKKGPIDFKLPVYVAYTGLSRELLDKYLADSKHLYEGYEQYVKQSFIGSTIGTHVGPGAVALAFFVEK